MGRLSGTSTPITAQPASGRLNVQENKNVEPLNVSNNDWNSLSFGQQLSAVTREVPKVLYNFLPRSTKDVIEKRQRGEDVGIKELVTKSAKGAGEFVQLGVQAIAQGIGGAVLEGVQKATGKEQRYNIPTIGMVSSYSSQKDDYVKAGFTEEESRALVGINAYLSIVPFVKPIIRLPVTQSLLKKATTQEVPFLETKAGLEKTLALEKKGKTLTPDLETKMVTVEKPLTTNIKEIFGRTESQKKFQTDLETHLDKYFQGRDTILSREDPLNAALLKLNELELKTYAEYTQGLITLVEKPSPAFKTAVDLARKTNAEIEADLISRGVLTASQVENRKWLPVEQTTGRSRAELQSMGVDPLYFQHIADDTLKKGDFIPSVGRRTKGGYQKRFTGKLLAEDSYIKDPKVAIPRHRLQVFKDKMNAEFVEQIKNDFSEKNPELLKIYRQNPKIAKHFGYDEWKPSGPLRFYPVQTKAGSKVAAVSRKVETYWVPETIKTALERYYKPGTLERALRMTYDPLIDLWRVSVLNLTPRWIYNNFQGNIMLSVLGKTDPIAYAKSFKESVARTRLGEKFGLEKSDIPAGVYSKEYARGEGSVKLSQLGSLPGETTHFIRPIENWLNLLEQAKMYPALRIPAATTQGIIRGVIAMGRPGAAVNKAIENWARAAVYISKRDGKFLGMKLDKPAPPAEGVKYVNEFLHDYSKLTRLERQTFRRVLPFWNWIKFITTFSLKFPYNHPMRARVAQTMLQEYIDYIETIDQKDDKQKSVLRIKTDVKLDRKPIYINVKSTLPFSDVFRTLPTNAEAIMRFLTSNPVSKILVERALKMNTYTGQAFSGPPGSTGLDQFGNPIRPIPSFLQHLGKQIPQFDITRDIIDTIRYGKPLKRYDTGEPKLFRGQVQTSEFVIEVLKYFGISLSAIDRNQLQRSVDRKGRKLEQKGKVYERQLHGRLQRMKEQSSLTPTAEASELSLSQIYNKNKELQPQKESMLSALQAPTREQIIKELEEERGQTLLPEESKLLATERELTKYGGIRIGKALVDPTGFIGALKTAGKKALTELTSELMSSNSVQSLKRRVLISVNDFVREYNFKEVPTEIHDLIEQKLFYIENAPLKVDIKRRYDEIRGIFDSLTIPKQAKLPLTNDNIIYTKENTKLAQNEGGKASVGSLITGAAATSAAVGASQIPSQTLTYERPPEERKSNIIAGVDLSNYATDPKHEANVIKIFNSLPQMSSPEEITAYIKEKTPKSPLNGQHVIIASQKYGIDPKLIVAVMQQDSSLGTKGKGARTRNPGNVGHNDAGRTVTFKSWQTGVNAVAEFLASNKVK